MIYAAFSKYHDLLNVYTFAFRCCQMPCNVNRSNSVPMMVQCQSFRDAWIRGRSHANCDNQLNLYKENV